MIPRCSNCHSTDRNPVPRSFDMDLPAPVLCDLCTVAISMGDLSTFHSLTRAPTDSVKHDE